jgi:chloramphenicol-sensitive protein RarD
LARGGAAGDRGAGALYALTAYGIWGFAPIYWVETKVFPAPELLAYRVIASLGVALLFIAMLRGWRELGAALRSRRSAASAVLAALLLGVNWLTFIWAVQHGQILATSLGYYINPLVNVLLGLLILGERLNRAQTLAVLLAAVGVSIQTFGHGELPWVALLLAGSFGLYGLVRKLGPAAPLAGFGIETLALAPLACAYLFHLAQRGDAAVPEASAGMQLLVAGSGPLTAVPLLAFASAAKRLPLSALGMFQYLAPTLSFLLAIGVYGEPFTRAHALSFVCVWLALALYFWDSLQRAPRYESALRSREPASLGGPT